MLAAIPARFRPALATLWELDLALAQIVSTSTDPRLGAIRLAWWRDQLDELDTEGPPAGGPRLQAIARHLMPATNGAMLSMVADAWLPLLEPFPWGDEVAEGLRQRGELLFAVASEILGFESLAAEPAGALWSLFDGAVHCSDPTSREYLLGQARTAITAVPARMPGPVRPLTVLAALAANDVLRRGPVSRVAAAITHRVRGTIPRS